MELSLLQLLAVVVAALGGGALARRLGYPAVLGELLAGVLLGPPLLGLLQPSDALLVLGEVGVLLMMLFIGLEIHPSELRKASTGGILAALGGFIAPFLVCTWLMWWIGVPIIGAVFVGVAAGVTSLATKSRILAELDLFDTRMAHVMMAGALVADTLSLVVFAALLGFAEAGTFSMVSVLLITAKAVAFFALSWVVAKWVLPPLIQRTGVLTRTDRHGRFLLAVVVGLVFAEGAHLAGMHGILGAFVAGLALRASGLGRAVEGQLLEQVRAVSIGFLAPFFFVTAGYQVDLGVLVRDPWLLLGVVVLATVGKIVGTAVAYLPTGHGWREGLAIGSGMNGRGAVEIVVAQIGLSMGIIDARVFSILVVLAIATTATVPVLLRWSVAWLEARGELARMRTERDRVLIVGAGRFARRIASLLSSSRPVTLVDINPHHVEDARVEGLTAVYGDALDQEIMEAAGAYESQAILTLTENRDVNALAANQARTVFGVPRLLLPVLDDDEGSRRILESLGATRLFAAEVALDHWESRLDSEGFEVEEVVVGDAAAIADVDDDLGLVVAVSRDGLAHPYCDGFQLRPGDRVTRLRWSAEPPAPDADRFEEAC